MLPENETHTFLGSEYAWSGATARLEDEQALSGGVRIWIPRWRPAFVTQVAPGGKETKFKVPFSRQQRLQFYRLCIEQDFVTIQPEERQGRPDEARPTIILTNSKGQQRMVSKWAGIQDTRFDAIYHALLNIAERTEGLKPIPEKLRPWQKAIFWAGIVLLLTLPFVSGYFLARRALVAWWPDDLILLARVLLSLVVAIPLLLAGLRWVERRKAAYDRLFTNTWLLLILSVLFFAVLVALPGFLYRVSLAVWAETAVGIVQTRVHSSYLDTNTGFTNKYSMAYSFQTADDRSYERRVSVSQAYFEALVEGNRVTVYYLPSLPHYSLLDFHVETETADYALILFAGVLAIYLFIGEMAIFGPILYHIWEERLR